MLGTEGGGLAAVKRRRRWRTESWPGFIDDDWRPRSIWIRFKDKDTTTATPRRRRFHSDDGEDSTTATRNRRRRRGTDDDEDTIIEFNYSGSDENNDDDQCDFWWQRNHMETLDRTRKDQRGTQIWSTVDAETLWTTMPQDFNSSGKMIVY